LTAVSDRLAGAATALAVARRRPPGSFSRRLWDSAADVFEKIVEHPFIVGLVDGELDHGCFVQFLEQDRHYLEAYARSLNLLAVKSPRPEWSRMFTRHAGDAIAAEEELQVQLLEALGSAVGDDVTSPTPTTFAYASHLIANCYDGSFLEGLATVLPCYWVYAEVGNVLQAATSTDPIYAKWIDSYAGAEYTAVVASVLDVADELGGQLGDVERRRCTQLYRIGTRLEWMFWDAAYRRETWPV
jgi:thiaminase (transcriptional activator TenA)